jgi:adenylate cyclase
MTWSRPISVLLAPALFLALGVAMLLLDGLSIPSVLSNRLFDAYQRHAAREASALPVKVLDLPAMDEDSLVKVTRLLAGQGARLVVFTAPLEPGPSPQSLSAKLPSGNNAGRAALATLPEPGHDLAVALQDIPGIVPVILGAQGRAPHIKARFVYRGTRDPFTMVPRFESAAAPVALLETHAAGSAAAALLPDADGVVRRAALVVRVGNALVPGIAAEALRVARGKADITAISDERNPLSFFKGVGIAALETDSRPVPAASDGRFWLRYAANTSQQVLNPNALEAVPLKDMIVVVGAQGAMVRTPFGPASVASVTAEAIENLIGGDVLNRPNWMPVAEAALLLALGAGMIFLLRFGLGWAAGVAMGGSALLFLLSWFFFVQQSLLMDAATPALALILAFGAGATAHIQDMRMAYAGLRLAFSDSLPRATIEKIARRPNLLNIEGEIRSVTYLVCGVRGLAGLAAAYKDDAAGFTRLMQKVLTPLIDQALAHGGTIDRLTADGFAAFWNAPLDDADHALHACEAANGMAIMSARVNEALAQDYRGEDAPPLVEIGVGVATGQVIAGGFGGYGRMGYSVNGGAVALAGRIQALSHQYGPALIVADDTKRAAERGFAFLEIDTIAASANDPPSALFAIMGSSVSRASPKFRALTVFHDHIFQAIRKQQWQMARELIAQCRRLSGASQKLYDLHLTRIAYFEKHPPGADWDGAFRPILE